MFESLNVYDCVIAFLSLIILYVVLRKILFKPVTEFMEKRTQSIRDSISDAEQLKSEAQALKLQYEAQMSEAKRNGEKIIAEATTKASRRSDEIISEAKQEAYAILANARVEIDREREQMIKGIRNQVAALAIEAASKVVNSNMDTESNKLLVNQFLDEEGAA